MWVSGCGGAVPTCPTEHCLALSVNLPPDVTANTVEVMLRDGERLTRHRMVGQSATAGSWLLPLSDDASSNHRRAVYVRAVVEAGVQQRELVGSSSQFPVDGAVTVPLDGCEQAPCAHPSARRSAAMTYVPSTRTLLMHGGFGESGAPLDDLWAWNGLAWLRLPSSPGPVARGQHGLAFDPVSGKVLLFGGLGSQGVLDDTWLLDVSSLAWERAQVASPVARRLFAMAEAPVGSMSGLMLFGGQDESGAVLGETWLWNGQRWLPGPSSLCPVRALLPSPVPRCRVGSTLLPWSQGRESILLGGWLGPQPATALESDESLWRWDGASWSLAPLYRPTYVLSRYLHAAVPMASSTGFHGAWVGFGDDSTGLRQDSYLLSAADGAFQPLWSDAPSPRAEVASAFDAEREEVVIFGGRSATRLESETLTFSSEIGYQRHGN